MLLEGGLDSNTNQMVGSSSSSEARPARPPVPAAWAGGRTSWRSDGEEQQGSGHGHQLHVAVAAGCALQQRTAACSPGLDGEQQQGGGHDHHAQHHTGGGHAVLRVVAQRGGDQLLCTRGWGDAAVVALRTGCVCTAQQCAATWAQPSRPTAVRQHTQQQLYSSCPPAP